MAACRFCGESAGILRSEHGDCRKRHDSAVGQFPGFFAEAMHEGVDVQAFAVALKDYAKAACIDAETFSGLTRKGVESMVATTIADRRLENVEIERVDEMCQALDIDPLDLTGAAVEEYRKRKIIHLLDLGQIPQIRLEGRMPLNLQRGEQLIYIFNGVAAYTSETESQYIAGTAGVSLRIAKGFSVRTGGVRGRREKVRVGVALGIGDLVITNRAVYFFTGAGIVRFDREDIQAVPVYEDGLALMGEAFERHIFKLADPEFAADVIGRLNNLD